jgi:NADPH:quinone reductase-like Zn-dependent oxidoreductase
MQAIVFSKPGEPGNVLELREVAEPMPKAGEVVVEVSARPIHPSDLFFVRGTYRIQPALPQIAGLSGVGTVVSAGPACGVAPGTRVAFRSPGTWAERVAVPVDRLFCLPDGVSDEDGAQLPLNPITAWGLLEMANPKAGDWIGLTAPSSSVAQLVTALATMRGVRVVPIEGTANADAIRARTGGNGLAALLDSVGGSLVERLFGAMRPGGTVIAYGALSNESITLRNGTLIYANLSWHGFGVDHWLASISNEAREHMLAVLCDAMRDHRLPLPVRARFALADFRDALRSAELRAPGKVFLE